MKYLAVLIIPFFIMSCSLEKEETNYVNGVFSFTTASVNINSIKSGTNTYIPPSACIDFTKGNGIITYTVNSKGNYGDSSDVDSYIRNSELRISRASFYFNDIAVDFTPSQTTVKYGNILPPQDQIITKNMLPQSITDGTYRLEIEMVASEYDGNGNHTVLNNTFSGYFGDVIISSVGQGCKY